MNLTDLQKFRIQTALREASAVLEEVKSHPLKGQSLRDMQILESSVQNMEIFVNRSI